MPDTVPCTDGNHTFLYSRDETRRYAYSLTWDENQDHILVSDERHAPI
jgi:hypothetical protein